MLEVPEHLVVRRAAHGRLECVRADTERAHTGVVVRMIAAGICGTDIGIYEGSRPGAASVLGHEGVGRVVAATVGTRFRPGDLVVVNPVSSTNPSEVIGHSRDGIFREYFFVTPEEADDFLVRIPIAQSKIADVMSLALCEPLASVLYALQCVNRIYTGAGSIGALQGVESGDLVVVGSGTIAVLAASLWTGTGRGSAFLLSSNREHGEWLSSVLSNPMIHCLPAATTCRNALPAKRVDKVLLCTSRGKCATGLSTALTIADEGAIIDLITGFPPEYHDHAELPGVPLDAIRWRNSRGSPPKPAQAHRTITGKKVHLTGHRGTGIGQLCNAAEMLSTGLVSLQSIPHLAVSLRSLPEVIDTIANPIFRARLRCVKVLINFEPASTERLPAEVV